MNLSKSLLKYFILMVKIFDVCYKVCYSRIQKPPVVALQAALFMVEMAGIEPASENQFTQASPSAVNLLKFHRPCADRQAQGISSL